MRTSRFIHKQITGLIKEWNVGTPTAEVCRRHGLSTATFYKLKARCRVERPVRKEMTTLIKRGDAALQVMG